MSAIFSLTMLAETLRIATPYACAAVGGIWAERSGVIQIGLEAVLLTSADNQMILANQRAERLFTASDDDSEGRRRAIQINALLFSSSRIMYPK